MKALHGVNGCHTQVLLWEGVIVKDGFGQAHGWFIGDAFEFAEVLLEGGDQLEDDAGLAGIGKLGVVDVGLVQALWA